MRLIIISALAFAASISITQAQSYKKPSIKAALDDLSIETSSTGLPQNNVFIRNKNTARAIVASVTVDGEKNFTVQSLSRTTVRRVFPQSFEVRIPPGQRKFIGFDKVRHVIASGTTEFPGVSHTVVGARYIADEPTPLPNPRDVHQSLFLYDIPVSGGGGTIATVFINLNYVFGVDFELLTRGVQQVSGSLVPLESEILFQGYSSSFTVNSAHFFNPVRF